MLHSYYEVFEKYEESGVEKIQKNLSISYKDAILLGQCIAHAYFDAEMKDLANKYDLSECELAALANNESLFSELYQEELLENSIRYADI